MIVGIITVLVVATVFSVASFAIVNRNNMELRERLAIGEKQFSSMQEQINRQAAILLRNEVAHRKALNQIKKLKKRTV